MADERIPTDDQDLLDLRFLIQAVDIDQAHQHLDRIGDAMLAYGDVVEAKIPSWPLELPSRIFTLFIKLRPSEPVVETRQRLLNFLGDNWTTKVETEAISDTEVQQTQVANWIEAGYKKKKIRFAFDNVMGATILGPYRVL